MPFTQFRPSEWVLLGFFAYIASIAPFFRDRTALGYQPLALLILITAFFTLLNWLGNRRGSEAVEIFRDWLPVLLTLVAFREMELFLPHDYNYKYELAWIDLDKLVLHDWRLRHFIEAPGKTLPFYFELCYLLVYGIAAYCVGILEAGKARAADRRSIDRFWTIYLIGTLLAYGLFPFFPSQPPRFVFPGVDPPTVTTAVRRLNLLILSKATIHSGVFPSAHVSAAFSCAWGMFLVRPRRRILCWGLLIYAVSVSIATVYGRYHYAADVVAGFAASLVAGGVAFLMGRAK